MLESLLCNSCGAPLEVPSSAKFVKCNHCNTTLKVHRSQGTTTSEVIEKLAETTEDLAAHVQELTRQRQLEELDRRWQTQRDSFLINDRRGMRQLPTTSSAWIGGLFVAFFGAIWTVLALSITSSGPDFGPFRIARIIFPLLGLGFIAFGIFTAVAVHQKAKSLQQADHAYRRDRERIERGDQ